MNCANPACGHPQEEHTDDGEPGGMLVCMHSTASAFVAGARHWCECFAFVPPTPSREPLLAQLDAVIRSRAQLP